MTKSRNLGLRLAAAVLCLVCLLCAVQPLSALAVKDIKPQSLTTVVRYTDSFSASSIGQIENGTEINVLGATRNFYKVDCYDMVGYIAKTQVVHKDDGKYYVNCQPDSSETESVTYTDYMTALTLRHDLFELAKKQLGTPYVYGGKRPGGFDCSGLTSYLYSRYGMKLQRRASQQMGEGIIVAKEGMQVGDLVFFKEAGESALCSHVGIYAGNNQIIHSGSNGVEFADLDYSYFKDYYLCARRIVNTGAVSMATPEVAAAPTARAAMPSGRRSR